MILASSAAICTLQATSDSVTVNSSNTVSNLFIFIIPPLSQSTKLISIGYVSIIAYTLLFLKSYNKLYKILF